VETQEEKATTLTASSQPPSPEEVSPRRKKNHVSQLSKVALSALSQSRIRRRGCAEKENSFALLFFFFALGPVHSVFTLDKTC
jgi:hypothetical protein